jgi:hypothetical protein
MAFVNVATFNSGATAVISIGATMPPYSAGDTLICAVATQGGALQVLGGLGAWTLAPNGRMDNPNGNLEVLAVYYIKNATGSETAPTITLTSKRICGFIASYSGRDASAPVATDHGTTNTASTNCTEATGITVTDATSDILFIGAAQNFVTALKPTAPGTWNTERVDISTSAVGAAQSSSISLYDSNQATGATGAVTSVISGSQPNNAYLMELIPAAAGGQPYAQRLAAGKAAGVWYPGRG